MKTAAGKNISSGRTMELLAPAGSFPAFEAALAEGADAVYVGAPGFNARALSRDFTFAEIDSMVRQAHRLGIKVFIAMNSLVKETEIPAVLEALSCFAQIRPDALIIQDLGLLYIARTWFPDIPLHASTLMSVHNSVAARELTGLGFDRVVLARELTIAEMASIREKTDADIEVFIHGAMCFSYSGLCMFSSLHGGKSSLRGQCVQPCRRHYSWLQSGKSGKSGREQTRTGKSSYLFSMNDLCGVDVLPELRDAGVSCLKIEGRMKSAQYVANTVAAYRMALDCMDKSDEEQESILREAHLLLDQAMARKRSSGYLLTEKPAEAVTPEQSGSSGQLLGRVQGLEQERGRDGRNYLLLRLTLAADLKEGDRLRLHNEKNGDRMSFTLRRLTCRGRRQKNGRTGQQVQLSFTADLQGQSGRNFKGSLYKVDVGSRLIGERIGRKRSKQLAGRSVTANRRDVEEILTRLAWKGSGKTKGRSRPHRKGRNTGKAGKSGQRSNRKELPWWVALTHLSDLQQRLPVRPARIIVALSRDNMSRLARFGNKINKFKGKIVWRLPAVIHEKDLSWYEQHLQQLVRSGYSRFELGHCSQSGLFSFLRDDDQARPVELYGSYSLNLLNSAALHCTAHLGFTGVQFSLETEQDNLEASVAHFKRHRGRGRFQQQMKVGVYVYGRPPLFTARLAGDHFQYRKPFVSPKQEQFVLEQSNGLTLARAVLPFSLLKWQQELQAMQVDYLLLDLSGGPVRKESAMVQTLLTRGGSRMQVLSGNFQGTLV